MRFDTQEAPKSNMDRLFAAPDATSMWQLHTCAMDCAKAKRHTDTSCALSIIAWQVACAAQGLYYVKLPNNTYLDLSLSIILKTENEAQAKQDVRDISKPQVEWERDAYADYLQEIRDFKETLEVATAEQEGKKNAFKNCLSKNGGRADKQRYAFIDRLRETPTHPRHPRLQYINPTQTELIAGLETCSPTAGVVAHGIANITPPDASQSAGFLDLGKEVLHGEKVTHYFPKVSVLATTTLQQWCNVLPAQMESNAWLNCLYVQHAVAPALHDIGNFSKFSPACEYVFGKISELLDQQRITLSAPDWSPTALTLSKEAWSHWKMTQDALHLPTMQQPQNVNEYRQNVYIKRLPELGVRIAALIHLLKNDQSSYEISVETLKEGLWMAYNSLPVFETMHPPRGREEQLANTLYEWLEQCTQRGQQCFLVESVLNHGPFLSKAETWQAIEVLRQRRDIMLNGYGDYLYINWSYPSNSTPPAYISQNNAFPYRYNPGSAFFPGVNPPQPQHHFQNNAFSYQ